MGLFFVSPRYNPRESMNTVTKPSQPRTTDTLRQALATLAALMDRAINEVNVLDSEFQERVLQAVHDTEESLQKQASDHLQLAIEESAQKTRAQVTEEFRGELQRLEDQAARANQELAASREEHLRDMGDTEEAAAIALDRQVSRAVERVRSELTTESDALRAEIERLNQSLAENKAEFHRVASEKEGALADAADNLRKQLGQATAESERTRHQLAEAENLIAANKSELGRELGEAAERVRAELTPERDRLARQVDELLHAAAAWDSERERFQREIKSATATADQAVTTARRELAMTHSGATEALEAEVARVEQMIQAISAIIDAPETELSLVIRKNVERAEFESYLRGIRFAVTGK